MLDPIKCLDEQIGDERSFKGGSHLSTLLDCL